MNDTKLIDCLRIHDPGHSWLRVSYNDLIDSGVELQISEFSMRSRQYAYLEEDLDLGTFVTAVKKQGMTVHVEEIQVEDFDEYLRDNDGRYWYFSADRFLESLRE